MAYQSHNCDRRNLLWGGALIAAAAALPATAMAQANMEWDAAMARLKAAEAEEAQYYTSTWNPADRARIDHGTPIPDNIEVKFDRLVSETDDRRWDLIKIPAANPTALRWKLENVLKDDGMGGIIPWGREHLTQVLADIARLLGDA